MGGYSSFVLVIWAVAAKSSILVILAVATKLRLLGEGYLV